jgi:importin subunit alpha-1
MAPTELAEESRRRREERTLRIRKIKKEEILHRRRGTTPSPRSAQSGSFSFATAPEVNDIPIIFERMKENPVDENVTVNLQFMHEILSADEPMATKSIVSNGCLPFLVVLLGRTDSQYFQQETAWILTKVCAAGFCHDVFVNSVAVQNLVTLLRSPHAQVRAHAAHCLGVMANDRVEFRDALHDMGVVQLL